MTRIILTNLFMQLAVKYGDLHIYLIYNRLANIAFEQLINHLLIKSSYFAILFCITTYLKVNKNGKNSVTVKQYVERKS